MVTRTTLRNASQRAQSYASRATLRELNSKPQWAEAKFIDVFPGETATDVEYAENYGGTSVPAKQDEEEEEEKQQGKQQQGSSGGSGTPGEENEQPKGDAAEAIVLYLNGSRSHPVIISVGDRRHRLLELEEGDVAQHRLKDDRQQMLYSKDGTYISTRSDKIMRIALVPKQQDQQQNPSQQQQANGAAAGPSGSGGGKQKKKKTMGQKSAKDDNKKSEVAIEQNGATTYSRHGEAYGSQKGGSDSTIHYEKDKKKSAQSTDEHVHIRFKEHRIFNDKDGNWATSPIGIKMDKYCKEG
jgi:phage gp45-like